MSGSVVWLHVSMSLDGYLAGPNVGVGNPMGDGGERLHDWAGNVASERDRKIDEEFYARSGAFVVGRTTYDVGQEPWGDPPPFDGRPVFVLTHAPSGDRQMSDGTVYRFFDDPRRLMEEARASAGPRDVCVIGGASLARQLLELGLIDEMYIHHVPLLLGSGARLFDNVSARELDKVEVVDTPGATHVRYRVRS